MLQLAQDSITHRIKYISVSTVIGSINRNDLIIKTSMRISGSVQNYKLNTDRHSGIAFRVYSGRFFGMRVGRGDYFQSSKCVLPPRADQIIYDAFCKSVLMTIFSLQINIIPCGKHSTGFDWSVDILPTPAENEIFEALNL